MLGDAPKHLDPGQIALHARRIGGVDIVQPHDLVLDVEIKLAPKKPTQIFVNKIVHGVARGVLRQVFLQQRAFLLRLRGCRRHQRRHVIVCAFDVRQEPLHLIGRLRQTLFPPGPFLPRLFRVGTVFELNDELGRAGFPRFELHRFRIVDDEVPLGLLGRPDIVVLPFTRLDDAAMHLDRLVFEQLAVMLPEFRRLCRVESEVAQIFRCLDVVLIAVRPVQIDFAPVIGNGIGGRFAVGFTREVPSAHKIAIVVNRYR